MAETIMVTENVFSKEDCERIIKAMPKARKHIYQKANDMSRQDIQLDGEIVFAEVAHEDMLAKSNNINLMRKLIETLHSAIEVYAEKFPIIKELCLFPSDWTHLHRGNPPISNDKYIMTGWYNYYLSEELI